MAPASDAQTVLSYYSLPPGLVRRVESLGNAGGWSGSRLWRIHTADQRDLCLRQWPREHPTPERLRLIHSVLERVFQSGLRVVPAPIWSANGQSFVEHTDHLWELTPWMPGLADYHAHPSRERLRCAMQILAQFHQLAASGGREPPEVAQPPAFIEREARISKLLRSELGALFLAVQRGVEPTLDGRARRILLFAGPRLKNLYSQIQPACEQALPLQPAIRDIWHDHVLFTGEAVSGIVDFDSLRIDTPLTDIARLVGSLVGDDLEARQFALDVYADLRPFAERDRRLIDLLDASGLVLAGLNWLTWLYLDRRDMGPTGPIIRRLDEILGRLERRAVR